MVQSSLRDYQQDYIIAFPSDKSLGYFHAPLRGKGSVGYCV